MRKIDPFWGPYDANGAWVPSLRYLMRRSRVLDLTAGFSPGTLLEVGCGAGALLAEFSAKGFRCTGLEPSEPARIIAKRLIAEYCNGSVAVVDKPIPAWEGMFDIVVALDVLEHIEDDEGALEAWHSWLVPQGTLVLSVPAHSRRWGAGDQWAGHYRRYDREQLINVLNRCGFRIEHIECYGFPLSNLSEAVGRHYYASKLKAGGQTLPEQASQRSGIERGAYKKLFGVMRSPIGKPLIWLGTVTQRLFLTTELGTGFLVVARRT